MKKFIGIIAFLMAVTLLFCACGQTASTSGESLEPESESRESISESNDSASGSESVDTDFLSDYEPSCATTSFPYDDLAKVSVTPTFDVSESIYDAEEIIVPYQLFVDGMCLQRDAVNKIWGTIENLEGNEHIAVKFRGRTYYGTVDGNDWEVYLPVMTAGGPFEMTIICDWGTKTIKDVYVGEVYLLSGQSNMEWKVEWSKEVLADLYADETCRNDNIRLLNLATKFREEPTKTLEYPPVWNGADEESIKNFSAVGYIFGKRLQEELDCPVGLVCNAIGGTITESWMDAEAYAEYEKTVDKTACDLSLNYKNPSFSFNGEIYPLEGFNFRGVCWYQGCSNIYDGAEKNHAEALRALIACWRRFFKNPQLTFSIAELARFVENPTAYSTINEKIGIVAREDDFVCNGINLDQGEWGNIHPWNKRPIGTRLANETLRNFFGKNENAAPRVISYEIVSDKEVRLVMSEDVELRNGANGFEVLTPSGFFTSCSASIENRVITVTSTVPFTGIRYGYDFKKTAEIVKDLSKTVTIFDKDGLPCDMFLIKFD